MKKIIVGISGGSGMPIASELLRQLHNRADVETHLVYTRGAELTIAQEADRTLDEICALADVVYDKDDIGAAIASGSFHTDGMIVVPCSMKTAAGIHSGYSDNLLLRAADVTLKERRKLVLVARECPLGTIHLRNLYELSQMGAMVLPPMLSYYNHPQTVEDCTRHIVGKILDQFDIEGEKFRRWEGMEEKAEPSAKQEKPEQSENPEKSDGAQEVRSEALQNNKVPEQKNNAQFPWPAAGDPGIRILEKFLSNGTTIKAILIPQGKDCTISVSGGDLPHAGSVVMSLSRPSLTGQGVSVTSSVINGIGHKDEIIARIFAETAAKKRGGTAVCSCGIHIDGITPEEIEEIGNICRELAEEMTSEN